MHQLLAEKLRPQRLEEIVGQDHILNNEGIITKSILQKRPISILLYGPAGCGKTSLAYLYAKSFSANFIKISAIFSNVSELKNIFQKAKDTPLFSTILFVDEIHRFNKAQQDAFLPYVEDGTIILVGATTENPSFSLNNALLSRLRIITMNQLDDNALLKIISRYEKTVTNPVSLTDEIKRYLIKFSHSDGRYLLNLLENLEFFNEKLSIPNIEKFLQRKFANYDKSSDNHYNLMSALHKSIRGSDPDASLYWFARILEGGEDPLYIIRRLIRIATEDISLANPPALNFAISAMTAYQTLGSPEGELAVAEAVIYLALSPKSNSVYLAYKKARDLAKKTNHLSPPKHILNAPTKFMKDLRYSKNYIYDHDSDNNFSGQEYFPKDLENTSFYIPKDSGFEKQLKE